MLALVGGAAAIGFAPIFVRWSEVGLNATAFWRLALAVPALLVICRVSGPVVMPKQDRMLLAFAGLCFALDLIFWHASIALTSVANSTLLANLTPIVVVLFYWVVRRERPTGRFALGAGLALVGAAGLALSSAGIGVRDAPAGDLLGVLTAFAYAGYLLAVERARDSTGGFQVLLASTAVAAVITGATGLALGEHFLPASPEGWSVLLGLALLVHVAGQGGIVWALGQLPASLSSVVILISPVVAAILGWLLLDEPLGPAAAASAGLVLAGVLIVRRR